MGVDDWRIHTPWADVLLHKKTQTGKAYEARHHNRCSGKNDPKAHQKPAYIDDGKCVCPWPVCAILAATNGDYVGAAGRLRGRPYHHRDRLHDFRFQTAQTMNATTQKAEDHLK